MAKDIPGFQDDSKRNPQQPKGEGTDRDTITTGNGKQDVATENGVKNPYKNQNDVDTSKEDTEARVKAVADAIKRDEVTVNPDTGRPIQFPGQTSGYQENLNNPYSTEGKTVGPLHVNEVQELREAAVKAEMNGHPLGASELRQKADELEQAQKLNDKENKKEGVVRK